MTTPIANIFFDVGNTLLFPDRHLILSPLRARNIAPSLELWRSIERRTKNQFDTGMHDGKPDLGFWSLFHSHLLADLGLENGDLHSTLVASMRTSANWTEIRPGTRQRLNEIAQRYRIGVISNADGKIADVLQHCDIADCFLTITDSGLVGHEKPHPAIFQAALREMGAKPEESLYVGDVCSVDYAGATSVGMQAVLFDVCGAYRESGLPRVESLEELQERLGEM